MLFRITVLFFLIQIVMIQVNAAESVAAPRKRPVVLQMSEGDFEVLATMRPDASGLLAKDHLYQFTLDADYVSAGRTTFRFMNVLHPFIAIEALVSLDSSYMSVLALTRNSLVAVPNQVWSIQAGIGAKFRVSEWFLKSSVFIEPTLQGGFSQTNLPVIGTTNAFRLLPSVAVGWEFVFDSGLIFAMRAGASMPFDFPQSIKGVNFQFNPSLGLGYAI